MNDLLNFAIEAHGGPELWNNLQTIKFDASFTGNIWAVKSRPDVLKEVTIELNTKQEKVKMYIHEKEKITVFEPNLVTIETNNSKDSKRWTNPKSLFKEHDSNTPWLDVHVAYFSGQVLWNLLTIPFLYSYPGFISEEIEPWYESGEVWRRLKVTFPKNIVGDLHEQISCFGPDGLIRRCDYTSAILEGETNANYATNYQNIDGLIVPTSWYIFKQKNHKVTYSPAVVSIEMSKISIW